MPELVFRLKENDDLRLEIEKNIATSGYSSGCIICAVGCVKKINIRLAKAINCLEYTKDYEIVSLMGTLSKNGSHMHISLADERGNVIGGHLKYGTIVNTTCEVVIYLLEEYELNRKFDVNTGYNELVVEKVNKKTI